MDDKRLIKVYYVPLVKRIVNEMGKFDFLTMIKLDREHGDRKLYFFEYDQEIQDALDKHQAGYRQIMANRQNRDVNNG